MSIHSKPFRFASIDCVCFSPGAYQGNSSQVSLQLVAADTENNRQMGIPEGSPVATASVCVPGVPFQAGFTTIKDYSENEGVLRALTEAGIVEACGQAISIGFASAPVVRVLDEAMITG